VRVTLQLLNIPATHAQDRSLHGTQHTAVHLSLCLWLLCFAHLLLTGVQGTGPHLLCRDPCLPGNIHQTVSLRASISSLLHCAAAEGFPPGNAATAVSTPGWCTCQTQVGSHGQPCGYRHSSSNRQHVLHSGSCKERRNQELCLLCQPKHCQADTSCPTHEQQHYRFNPRRPATAPDNTAVCSCGACASVKGWKPLQAGCTPCVKTATIQHPAPWDAVVLMTCLLLLGSCAGSTLSCWTECCGSGWRSWFSPLALARMSGCRV
jgi:hypothetical protein